MQKVVEVWINLPWTSHGNNICSTEISSNHPEKDGKMSQKQSTSACTHIRIHSEMGKENKAHILKSYHFVNIYNIITPKRMKWDENGRPCYLILRWGWIRLKRHLAFNNDDGKITDISRLFTYKKINTQFNYYATYTPAFNIAQLRCLKIEIK